MKKSTSSVNNNRDISSSQRKRMRSSTPAREEEEEDDAMSHANGDSCINLSQKKNKKVTSENRKGKGRIDTNNHADRSTTFESIPSGSSISFSSSSSKDVTSKNNKTLAYEKQSVVNDSVISTNSSEKSLTQPRKKPRSSTTTTNDTLNQPISSHSKSVRSPLTSRENLSSHNTNSSQRVSGLNLSRCDNSSSATASSGSYLNKTTTSIDPSIEGSLEYRELKRMYLRERNQAEEWRKDYYVIKKQLAKVKETTIPRPNAEVLEWLQELLYIMNNNVTFIGDDRDLKQIGEDLGLDEASLLTVTARTPQKSALKLFRLLYPTVGNRANCISIAKMNAQQLGNIYYYVRKLHKNLSFTKDDMRKAIGTSIRSARRDLHRHQAYQQQHADVMDDEQDNDTDEGIDDTIDRIDDAQTEDEEDNIENIHRDKDVVMNEDLDVHNKEFDETIDGPVVDSELDEESD